MGSDTTDDSAEHDPLAGRVINFNAARRRQEVDEFLSSCHRLTEPQLRRMLEFDRPLRHRVVSKMLSAAHRMTREQAERAVRSGEKLEKYRNDDGAWPDAASPEFHRMLREVFEDIDLESEEE